MDLFIYSYIYIYIYVYNIFGNWITVAAAARTPQRINRAAARSAGTALLTSTRSKLRKL